MPNNLIGPAIIATVISSAVGLLAIIINRSVTIRMNQQKVDSDKNLAERKINADIALAEKKLHLDRSLSDWKRRTELAEQVLSDFYKAHHIFREARVPWSNAGEGASRTRINGEDDGQARYRDSIYATFERLSNNRDFFSDLHTKRFRFMAMFGSNAEGPFLTLVRSHNKIAASTGALIHHRDSLDAKRIKQHEENIGWGVGEDDEITLALQSAVDEIEKICQPILNTNAD